MKVQIFPGPCGGSVKIPPSKSLSHRAILCAALAEGKSVIRNIAFSDDILTTIEGMRQLGAKISASEDRLEIEGTAGRFTPPSGPIQCNESGSTLRFFIPVFSLLDQEVSFCGKNRLLKRPQSVYEEIFSNQGIPYSHTHEAITIGGRLHPGRYEVDGSVSSQFLSGLLFTLPLLQGDSELVIRPPFESASYVGLTLEMLARFGIRVEQKDALHYTVPGGQQYRACDYIVEGDDSQMAFFGVLGAINHTLCCTGLTENSKQGDRAIVEILRRCGAQVEAIEGGFRFHSGPLCAYEADLGDCPDLGPILTVLGMHAEGESRIYHAARLRDKESDRILAMETELKKFGVNIRSTRDEIWIHSISHYGTTEPLYGHKDHRIVMSLAIAATLADRPVVIEGAEAINKSYPAFFEDLGSVGIRWEQMDD